MAIDALDALETLLDHERGLLKAGRLQDLASLEDQKRLLTQALSKLTTGPGDLARLQQKVLRNQALLEATGAGIKAAKLRLENLRRAAGPIPSYGAAGQPRAIGAVQPSLTKKA